MTTLNPMGKRFAAMLAVWQQQKDRRNAAASIQYIHVVGAGRTLTSAFEQLRNAAEYTEEHLLLQHAIRRFYKRLFLTGSVKEIRASGSELITELTFAGYLQNDTIPEDTIPKLDKLASEYFTAYTKLLSKGHNRDLNRWITDILAVEAEALIADHTERDLFLQFAFDHFLASLDRASFESSLQDGDYELSLFVAVHQALLKSDAATIRWALLKRFQQVPSILTHYVHTNQEIDRLFASPGSDTLFRLVDRRGAALRILWRMMNDRDELATLLNDENSFLAAYEQQVVKEYKRINQRVNAGIIKSVAFLIITKFVVGVAIEVPYDRLVLGAISPLPLLINLALPPLYMVLLRLTLTLPPPANTRALLDEARSLLYKEAGSLVRARLHKQHYSAVFNVVYGTVFIGIFSAVAWLLAGIGFGIIHLLIFFVFFSTASFLGFRLSRLIRELEIVESEQSGVSLIRDFLYLPFVVTGRWLSDKYSRVNVVSIIFDMIIELPLKTILRLVRQWGAFISTKKDEI